MKKTLFLALILTAVASGRLPAQPAPPPSLSVPAPQPLPSATETSFADRAAQLKARAEQSAVTLTRFDLNFPGGTARQLADAIEKAMGKPLNVIVPEEFAEAKLPPIKVSDVTVPQLFKTLPEGSYKRSPGRGEILSSYGFKSIDGPQTDATIWTFLVYKNQEASGGLTQFSIDFPGGTPKQLVAAIQKATGHSLNVIVPEEFADMKLPPLKMNDVDVSQLFHALELASIKVETYRGGNGPFQQKTTSYGFRTDGKLSDDTVWYFHADKVAPPPGNSPDKISRFYALAPYLNAGLKVDDITTAVETAWKMSGETKPPAISFHKDTKLLIAFGEPEKLLTIDAILQALKPEPPKSQFGPPPPEKKSGEAKAQD